MVVYTQRGKFFIYFRRLIAITLLICFNSYPLPLCLSAQSPKGSVTPSYGIARPEPKEIFGSIALPEEIGRIQSSYWPDETLDRKKTRLVFHIQNAHTNADSERNVFQLIRFLQKQYGIQLIFLEGGQGPLDGLFFRAFPKEDLKRQILNRYLKRGELSGGELAAIESAPGQGIFLGAEDQSLYEKNVDAFRQAVEKQDFMMEKLFSEQTKLRERSEKFLSAASREFLQIRNNFETGKAELLSYLIKLHELYERFVDATSQDVTAFQHQFPEIIKVLSAHEAQGEANGSDLQKDFDLILRNFLADIYPVLEKRDQAAANTMVQDLRTGQTSIAAAAVQIERWGQKLEKEILLPDSLKRQTEHFRSLSEIQGTLLFQEVKSLESRVRHLLPRTNEEEKLLEQFDSLALLRRLVLLELDHEDWAKIGPCAVGESCNLELHGWDWSPFFSFYVLANERDGVLFDNVESEMDLRGENMAILVTGGFHSEGISAKMRDEHTAYMTVLPMISEPDSDRSSYMNVMSGGASIMKYFSKSLWDAFAVGFMVEVFELAKGPAFSHLLRTWRDRIVQESVQSGMAAETGGYTQYVDAMALALKEDFDPAVFAEAEQNYKVARKDGALDAYFQDLRTTVSKKFETFETGIEQFWAQPEITAQESSKLAGAINSVSVSHLATALLLIRHPESESLVDQLVNIVSGRAWPAGVRLQIWNLALRFREILTGSGFDLVHESEASERSELRSPSDDEESVQYSFNDSGLSDGARSYVHDMVRLLRQRSENFDEAVFLISSYANQVLSPDPLTPEEAYLFAEARFGAQYSTRGRALKWNFQKARDRLQYEIMELLPSASEELRKRLHDYYYADSFLTSRHGEPLILNLAFQLDVEALDRKMSAYFSDLESNQRPVDKQRFWMVFQQVKDLYARISILNSERSQQLSAATIVRIERLERELEAKLDEFFLLDSALTDPDLKKIMKTGLGISLVADWYDLARPELRHEIPADLQMGGEAEDAIRQDASYLADLGYPNFPPTYVRILAKQTEQLGIQNQLNPQAYIVKPFKSSILDRVQETEPAHEFEKFDYDQPLEKLFPIVRRIIDSTHIDEFLIGVDRLIASTGLTVTEKMEVFKTLMAWAKMSPLAVKGERYCPSRHELFAQAAAEYSQEHPSDEPIRIMSLGSGSGSAVYQDRKMMEILGLKNPQIVQVDFDLNMVKKSMLYNSQDRFILLDLIKLLKVYGIEDMRGKFDFVDFKNVLHEVYSFKGMAGVLDGAALAAFLLKPDGRLFLLDGVVSDRSEEPVVVNFKNDLTRQAYERFVQSYRFSTRGPFLVKNNRVVMTYGELTRFLSKVKFLTKKEWQVNYDPNDELKQLYAFATVQQYEKILSAMGFQIQAAEVYAEESYLTEWQSWLEVEPLEGSERTLYEDMSKAFEILGKDLIFKDQDFVEYIRSNPFLLTNLRLFELIEGKAPDQIAEMIRTFYPKGGGTEFINVYPDEIQGDKMEAQPIGIGSIEHAHPAPGDPIDRLAKEHNELPFVHGAASFFILIEDESGELQLLTTIRAATNRKYPGKAEPVMGGHIGAFESVRDAVIREIAEELGLLDARPTFIGYKRFENKLDMNNHGFGTAVILSRDQSRILRVFLKEKNVDVFQARNESQYAALLPSRIEEQTGRSVAERTSKLTGISGTGREISYAILAPFDTVASYYQHTKESSGLGALVRDFAWISSASEGDYSDGNMIGNEAFVQGVRSLLEAKRDTSRNGSRSESRIDPKGRISIPAKWRSFLGSKLAIVPAEELNVLHMYPYAVWEDMVVMTQETLERKVTEAQTDEERTKAQESLEMIMTTHLAMVHEAEQDAQGRIHLGFHLNNLARDVTLTKYDDFIELRSRKLTPVEKLERIRLDEAPMKDNEALVYQKFARTLIEKAKSVLAKYPPGERKPEIKEDLSLVTKADREIQQQLVENILQHYPDHYVLGEEMLDDEWSVKNEKNKRRSDFVWVIDPIDGTSHFSDGTDYFAVSIALYYRGKPVLASVFSPANGGVLLEASKARPGVYLNGGENPIGLVDQESFPKRVLVAIDRHADMSPEFVSAVLDGFRSEGSEVELKDRVTATVLTVSNMIVGENLRLVLGNPISKIWDVAAVAYLMEKAGGKFGVLSQGLYRSGFEVIQQNLSKQDRTPGSYRYMTGFTRPIWLGMDAARAFESGRSEVRTETLLDHEFALAVRHLNPDNEIDVEMMKRLRSGFLEALLADRAETVDPELNQLLVVLLNTSYYPIDVLVQTLRSIASFSDDESSILKFQEAVQWLRKDVSGTLNAEFVISGGRFHLTAYGEQMLERKRNALNQLERARVKLVRSRLYQSKSPVYLAAAKTLREKITDLEEAGFNEVPDDHEEWRGFIFDPLAFDFFSQVNRPELRYFQFLDERKIDNVVRRWAVQEYKQSAKKLEAVFAKALAELNGRSFSLQSLTAALNRHKAGVSDVHNRMKELGNVITLRDPSFQQGLSGYLSLNASPTSDSGLCAVTASAFIRALEAAEFPQVRRMRVEHIHDGNHYVHTFGAFEFNGDDVLVDAAGGQFFLDASAPQIMVRTVTGYRNLIVQKARDRNHRFMGRYWSLRKDYQAKRKGIAFGREHSRSPVSPTLAVPSVRSELRISENPFLPVDSDWMRAFPNNEKPLIVDVGVRDGIMSALRSRYYPDYNFVWIDLVQDVVTQQALRMASDNIRIVYGRDSDVFQQQKGHRFVSQVIIQGPSPEGNYFFGPYPHYGKLSGQARADAVANLRKVYDLLRPGGVVSVVLREPEYIDETVFWEAGLILLTRVSNSSELEETLASWHMLSEAERPFILVGDMNKMERRYLEFVKPFEDASHHVIGRAELRTGDKAEARQMEPGMLFKSNSGTVRLVVFSEKEANEQFGLQRPIMLRLPEKGKMELDFPRFFSRAIGTTVHLIAPGDLNEASLEAFQAAQERAKKVITVAHELGIDLIGLRAVPLENVENQVVSEASRREELRQPENVMLHLITEPTDEPAMTQAAPMLHGEFELLGDDLWFFPSDPLFSVLPMFLRPIRALRLDVVNGLEAFQDDPHATTTPRYLGEANPKIVEMLIQTIREFKVNRSIRKELMRTKGDALDRMWLVERIKTADRFLTRFSLTLHPEVRSEMRQRSLIDSVIQERKKAARRHSNWPTAVAVFGGARVRHDHPYYRLGVQLGELMWKKGFIPRTGAGLGMMEAPLEGFTRARRKRHGKPTQGVKIELPFETVVGPHAETVDHYNRFVIRKVALHENIFGAIALPGGFGTFDELFEVGRRGRPYVLLGTDFWQPFWDAFESSWKEAGIFHRVAQASRPLITDSIDDALEYIRNASLRSPPYLTPRLRLRIMNWRLSKAYKKLERLPKSIVFVGRPHTVKGKEELDVAAGLATRLNVQYHLPVRTASRGPLLNRLLEESIAQDWLHSLQAVLFLPHERGKIRSEEQILYKHGNAVFLDEESNHQFLMGLNSRGFVFLPGGIGTMNKLFDILTVMQTRKISRKPIVLIGSEFWQPIKDAIVRTAYQPENNLELISRTDPDLLMVVDTVEDALHALGLAAESGVEIARSESRLLVKTWDEFEATINDVLGDVFNSIVEVVLPSGMTSNVARTGLADRSLGSRLRSLFESDDARARRHSLFFEPPVNLIFETILINDDGQQLFRLRIERPTELQLLSIQNLNLKLWRKISKSIKAANEEFPRAHEMFKAEKWESAARKYLSGVDAFESEKNREELLEAGYHLEGPLMTLFRLVHMYFMSILTISRYYNLRWLPIADDINEHDLDQLMAIEVLQKFPQLFENGSGYLKELEDMLARKIALPAGLKLMGPTDEGRTERDEVLENLESLAHLFQDTLVDVLSAMRIVRIPQSGAELKKNRKLMELLSGPRYDLPRRQRNRIHAEWLKELRRGQNLLTQEKYFEAMGLYASILSEVRRYRTPDDRSWQMKVQKSAQLGSLIAATLSVSRQEMRGWDTRSNDIVATAPPHSNLDIQELLPVPSLLGIEAIQPDRFHISLQRIRKTGIALDDLLSESLLMRTRLMSALLKAQEELERSQRYGRLFSIQFQETLLRPRSWEKAVNLVDRFMRLKQKRFLRLELPGQGASSAEEEKWMDLIRSAMKIVIANPNITIDITGSGLNKQKFQELYGLVRNEETFLEAGRKRMIPAGAIRFKPEYDFQEPDVIATEYKGSRASENGLILDILFYGVGAAQKRYTSEQLKLESVVLTEAMLLTEQEIDGLRQIDRHVFRWENPSSAADFNYAVRLALDLAVRDKIASAA